MATTSSFFNSARITEIVVDPRNRDTAYVVVTGFTGASGTSRVFKTTNAGQSWTDISAGLPDLPAYTLVVDPRTSDLYLGNDNGVYKLTIDKTKVHPVGSPTTNMAADSTTVFHRLYGDIGAPTQTGSDFSALVNSVDNLQFRGAFNKPAGGGYLAFFDVNGDGIVNTADNLQFRTRFNKTLTWTV